MCFAALTRMNQFKKLHFAEVASALNVNVEAREAAAAMFGSKADRIVVFYTATAILGFQLGARQQQQQPYTALTHTMRLRRCQVSIQFVKLCQAAMYYCCRQSIVQNFKVLYFFYTLLEHLNSSETLCFLDLQVSQNSKMKHEAYRRQVATISNDNQVCKWKLFLLFCRQKILSTIWQIGVSISTSSRPFLL